MSVSLRGAAKRVVKRLVPPSLIAPLVPFSKPEITSADWDEQYSGNAWTHLHTASELPRYSLIVGYCQFFRPGGAVLDIGCGDGVLAGRLATGGFSRYLGVDVSASAVEAAQAQARDGFRFAVGDAERFAPPEHDRFDLLVFNEILYYLADPAREAERYAGWLARDGRMIVSLENVVRGHQIWTMLRRSFDVVDGTRVTHGRLSWDVRVLQLRA